MIKKIIIGFMGFLLFIGLILPWLIPVGNDTKTPEQPFPESHFTDIYGTRIHYRNWEPEKKVCGKVLLIHGFAGSTFSYRKMIPLLLQQGYQVTAIDLPAYGYSDRNINANTLPDPILCLILMRTIDAERQDFSPWVLAGHSMGASVAGEIAAAYPRICKQLILIDGVPALRPGNAGTGGLLTTALFKRWAGILGQYFFITPGRIEQLLTSAYGTQAPEEAVQGYLQALKVNGTAEAILKKFRYGEKMPHGELTSEINIRVIWGEKDTWIPLSVGQQFIEKKPHAKLTIIENAGHIPIETHPDQCLDVFQCIP